MTGQMTASILVRNSELDVIWAGGRQSHISRGVPCSMTMKAAVHVVVSGRVQGVGYRYFARQKALEHNLVGTVRNMPDGCVEVRAEGAGGALESLIAELRRGPVLSRVLECTANPVPPTGGYSTFAIVH